jgi:hypothetical protein
LTDSSIEEVSKYLTHLRQVNLGALNLTDTAVLSLFEAAVSLEVRFSWHRSLVFLCSFLTVCFFVGAIGYQSGLSPPSNRRSHLVPHLSAEARLVSLSLFVSCSPLLFVYFLGLVLILSVRLLTLHGCVTLTDESLRLLCAYSPLRHLDLLRCSGFTDEGRALCPFLADVFT